MERKDLSWNQGCLALYPEDEEIVTRKTNKKQSVAVGKLLHDSEGHAISGGLVIK